MNSDVIRDALTLFFVLDPFGNMVIFHTTLSKLPEERRTKVLVRELLFAMAIMLFFLLAGKPILGMLKINPATLSLSGGLMLFMIALGMVFPSKSMFKDKEVEDPFIVPLAVPLLAGPSSIALLMLMAANGQLQTSVVSVIVAWAVSAVILLVSGKLLKLLGSKGTHALERLMGLILILISIQMFLDGMVTAGLLPHLAP